MADDKQFQVPFGIDVGGEPADLGVEVGEGPYDAVPGISVGEWPAPSVAGSCCSATSLTDITAHEWKRLLLDALTPLLESHKARVHNTTHLGAVVGRTLQLDAKQ